MFFIVICNKLGPEYYTLCQLPPPPSTLGRGVGSSGDSEDGA